MDRSVSYTHLVGVLHDQRRGHVVEAVKMIQAILLHDGAALAAGEQQHLSGDDLKEIFTAAWIGTRLTKKLQPYGFGLSLIHIWEKSTNFLQQRERRRSRRTAGNLTNRAFSLIIYVM